MSVGHAALLFVAAALGGLLNSIAGGGSFVTFPALIFTGVGPVIANATSTVALWSSSAASAVGYRKELAPELPRLKWLAPVSVLGGVLGALTLIRTPPSIFVALLPFLMLTAALAFTFGDRLKKAASSTEVSPVAIAVVQFAIGVYGGYFGGGMGFFMLAAFALLGMKELHAMNGLKAALGVCINGVAVLTFAVSGAVSWPQALLMAAGAVLGGFGGASIARRVDAKKVRTVVTVLAWAITVWFFVRALGA